MGNHKTLALDSPQPHIRVWRPTWISSTVDQSQAGIPARHWTFTIENGARREKETSCERRAEVESKGQFQPASNVPPGNSEMTVADFIQYHFVPEHVASMRAAGHDYFQAILKHVLSPEQVDRTFNVDTEKSRSKLKAVQGWPYLDAQRLCDVRPDHIQRIITAALEHGYSIQTATHIRNVIRKVFSHARNLSCFEGDNPATRVVLPRMSRKQAHAFTPDQLRHVIQNMRYPERDAALLGVLTGMRVAEIFGLQWKYVNLSDARRLVDGEWIPAKMIAVRKQSYRSQIRPVTGSRKRDLPISELISRVLHGIKARKDDMPKDAFVFSSREGTPINQDNLAARRLKLIGKRLEMPWLSWNVFHRTSAHLTSESLKRLQSELKHSISPGGARAEYRYPSDRFS